MEYEVYKFCYKCLPLMEEAFPKYRFVDIGNEKKERCSKCGEAHYVKNYEMKPR